jgi:hypothetical protein
LELSKTPLIVLGRLIGPLRRHSHRRQQADRTPQLGRGAAVGGKAPTKKR